MNRGKKNWKGMVAGILFFLMGLVLIVCTLPVFSYTRQELVQIPKSEAVVDNTFDLHEFKDEIVQFQISIGQSLDIYATCSGNMTFLIANFTKTDGAVDPDKPDIVYFNQTATAAINTTWSPQSRVPDLGEYYLVFLARNVSSNSPLHVYANATKIWTDYQLKDVVAENRIPLLDQNFVYLGSAMAILGTALFSITLSRSHRPRNRK